MAEFRGEDRTPPLVRHPALRPLSREHMGGLVQARNLVRAAEGDAAARRRAVDDFVGVWRAEIRDHFDDEERLLLPLTGDAALRERLLAEHATLRDLAARCEGEPDAVAADAGLVRRIGELLHDHIRWEERVYFEAVQREHPDALAAMLGEAEQIEHRRPASRARVRLEGWPPRSDGAGEEGGGTTSGR